MEVQPVGEMETRGLGDTLPDLESLGEEEGEGVPVPVPWGVFEGGGEVEVEGLGEALLSADCVAHAVGVAGEGEAERVTPDEAVPMEGEAERVGREDVVGDTLLLPER